MQEMEFTVQEGKLWMLQTRTGKRTTQAALKIAVDMVAEGVIEKREAICRVEPTSLDQLLHPTLDPEAERATLGTGLPASPGAVSGHVVFTAEDAETWAGRDEKAILVRSETSPEDIGGMHVAQGILTIRGGMTSHAAVVARGMGKPCVCGAGALDLDPHARTISADGRIIREGDVITIDGGSGEIYLGEVATVYSDLTGDFGVFMEWADDIRTLSVRANAETRQDAETALRFGAEGIGLCRTEHMFSTRSASCTFGQ
jgi:pyruvate,orthophosphate dikinase